MLCYCTSTPCHACRRSSSLPSRMTVSYLLCRNAASVAYEMVYTGACVNGTWLSTVHGIPSVQACSVKARSAKSSKPITHFTYAADNGECAFYAGVCTGGDDRKRFSTYKLTIGSEEGEHLGFQPTFCFFSSFFWVCV